MNPNNHLLTREFLINHYCTEGLTTTQIAQLFSVSVSTVNIRLGKFGIPKRAAAPKRGNKQTEAAIRARVEGHRNNGKPWHSEECKRKISIANKGRQHTSEHDKNRVASRLSSGKPYNSEATLAKIRRATRSRINNTCPSCKLREKKVWPSGHRSDYCGECLNQKNSVRYYNNLPLRISKLLSGGLRRCLRSQSVPKTSRIYTLLGCEINEFKAHIEKLWQPGMTWQNWTTDGWHLDHIRPGASFNLADPEQQKECFHYTNFQPLWAQENMHKSSTFEGNYYRFKSKE